MGERRLLGELLLEAGLVGRAELDRALQEQRLRGGRLCVHLMRQGGVTPAGLFLFLQEHFGIIAPDLLEALREHPRTDLIPARLAHFYQMVPLRVEGDRLLLGVGYVDNPALIPAVEEITGLRVEPLICPPALLQESLAKFFPLRDEAGVARRATEENEITLSDPDLGILPLPLEALPESASPVAHLRAVLIEAIKRRSREILIEPAEGGWRVTYRNPEAGDLTRHLPPGPGSALGMVLEDLGRLAIRGRTVPREGRCLLVAGERRLCLVIVSLPSLLGDAYQLCILEERLRRDSLDEMLECYPEARDGMAAALDREAGLLIVAGPEAHLRDPIVAALAASSGNPADRRLILTEGPAVGRGAALKASLSGAVEEGREVLGVGEVRSPEELAALLEFSDRRRVVAGIEASDAFGAFEWLRRAGLFPALRGGHLAGILGVRRVERLCEHCRRRYELLDEFPNLLAVGPEGGIYFVNSGCRACRGAGVRDLEAAFEFLPGSPELLDRLSALPPPTGVRREGARLGVQTLFNAVMARAAAGEVDVREPLRLLLRERAAG